MPRVSAEYLAGFMDGEGSINIYVHPTRGTAFARVDVCNTNLDVILAIRESFGGILREKSPRKPNHKVVYVLYWNGRKGIRILEAIKPWLIVKNKQADLVLKFQETIRLDGSTKKLSAEEISGRILAFNRIKSLNKRGVA